MDAPSPARGRGLFFSLSRDKGKGRDGGVETSATAETARRYPVPGILPIAITALAGIIAILLSIAFLDRPVAEFVHRYCRDAPIFARLTHIIDPFLPIAGLVLVGAGIAAAVGWRPRRWARAILAAAAATLLAAALCWSLKYACGRAWPETWIDDNPSWIRDGVYGFFPFHGGQGYASFPSGHTTIATAPVAALWRGFRAWRLVFAITILLVVIGLVGADYHFLGDTIAGFCLGAGTGLCVGRLVSRSETAPGIAS